MSKPSGNLVSSLPPLLESDYLVLSPHLLYPPPRDKAPSCLAWILWQPPRWCPCLVPIPLCSVLRKAARMIPLKQRQIPSGLDHHPPAAPSPQSKTQSPYKGHLTKPSFPLCPSLNTQGTCPHQGLCTGCSLFSSWLSVSLLSDLCFRVTFSMRPTLTILLKSTVPSGIPYCSFPPR